MPSPYKTVPVTKVSHWTIGIYSKAHIVCFGGWRRMATSSQSAEICRLMATSVMSWLCSDWSVNEVAMVVVVRIWLSIKEWFIPAQNPGPMSPYEKSDSGAVVPKLRVRMDHSSHAQVRRNSRETLMDSERHNRFKGRIRLVKVWADRRRGDSVLNLSYLHSQSEPKLCYADH